MQDEDKVRQIERKRMLLRAVGEEVQAHRLKIKKGINLFSYEYDIGNGLLSRLERGDNEAKISTLWKLANAFGYKCSDFVALIEKRLPESFDFYD